MVLPRSLALDKGSRIDIVFELVWDSLGGLIDLCTLNFCCISMRMGNGLAGVSVFIWKWNFLLKLTKMIPVIVEHLVCAVHFIHILALHLTANQIKDYYLQLLKVNVWRSVTLPRDWGLHATKRQPRISACLPDVEVHPLKDYLIPGPRSLFSTLPQNWSRAGAAGSILSSLDWLISDWPRAYRKQMEQTLRSCWAQKRQSSPDPSVFFIWHFVR